MEEVGDLGEAEPAIFHQMMIKGEPRREVSSFAGKVGNLDAKSSSQARDLLFRINRWPLAAGKFGHVLRFAGGAVFADQFRVNFFWAEHGLMAQLLPKIAGLAGEHETLAAIATALADRGLAIAGKDLLRLEPVIARAEASEIEKAGPRVGRRIIRQARPHRVQVEVHGEMKPMPVRYHQYRFEAALEEMPVAAVTAVKTNGIGGVQPVEGDGEVGLGGSEEKVVMVAHQAKGEDLKVEAGLAPGDQG